MIAQALEEFERGGLSSEIEEGIMAMLHNKIARAQQDLAAAGAGPVAVEQFGIACLAECVARFRARQSLMAIGASARLH